MRCYVQLFVSEGFSWLPVCSHSQLPFMSMERAMYQDLRATDYEAVMPALCRAGVHKGP